MQCVFTAVSGILSKGFSLYWWKRKEENIEIFPFHVSVEATTSICGKAKTFMVSFRNTGYLFKPPATVALLVLLNAVDHPPLPTSCPWVCICVALFYTFHNRLYHFSHNSAVSDICKMLNFPIDQQMQMLSISVIIATLVNWKTTPQKSCLVLCMHFLIHSSQL